MCRAALRGAGAVPWPALKIPGEVRPIWEPSAASDAGVRRYHPSNLRNSKAGAQAVGGEKAYLVDAFRR